MKKFVHWAAIYAFACGSMFALLLVVDIAKGTSFADAWASALAWAVMASAIFVGSRYYRSQRGQECAVCERIGLKQPD